MLIDEVHITIKAGDGGDGRVSFYNDAFRPKGGPDGGIGGDGGSVYFEAVSDVSKLNQFRHAKVYSAGRGQQGGQNNCTATTGQRNLECIVRFVDNKIGDAFRYSGRGDNRIEDNLIGIGKTMGHCGYYIPRVGQRTGYRYIDDIVFSVNTDASGGDNRVKLHHLAVVESVRGNRNLIARVGKRTRHRVSSANCRTQ